MALLLRGKTLWVDLESHNVRFSCKTGDRAKAQQQHDAAVKALAAGRTLTQALSKGGNTSSSTLADAWDRSMRLHYKGKKSERTVEFHRQWVYSVIAPTTLLRDLCMEDVERLVAAIQAKGNGPASINRVTQTFGKVLGLAVEWKMLDSALKMPHFEEPSGRIREYTRAEEGAIVAEFLRRCEYEMIDLTVLLVDTGLRLGEVLRRDCLAHDKQKSTIHVWDTKVKGLSRVVPLTRRANDALEGWLESKALTKDQIESRWQTMRRHLGYTSDRQFVIHTLRHTCCTRLVRAGMEIRRVMMWMGHLDVKTTLRYTHLCPSDLQPLVEALESAATTPLEQPVEVPAALVEGQFSNTGRDAADKLVTALREICDN